MGLNFSKNNHINIASLFAGILVVVITVMTHITIRTITPGVFFASQTAAVSDFDSSMVAHYTFNNVSGSDVPDSAGSNKGTLINGAVVATGNDGQGVNFDGADDAITTSNDSVGTGAVTVSAWIYPRSLGAGSTGRIVDNGRFRFNMRSGNTLGGSSSSGGNLAGQNAITLNTWQMVTVTRDSSGTMNFYVNGSPSGPLNQSSGLPIVATGALTIGNSSTGSAGFDGIIDDLRVYNRVLTPSEVASTYSGGITGGGTSTPPPSGTSSPEPLPNTPVLPNGTSPQSGAVSVQCVPDSIRCVSEEYTSIQACADAARPGDTCLIGPGTYEERVRVSVSGIASAPITFRAISSGTVVRGFLVTGSFVNIDGFEVTHASRPGSFNYPAFYISGTIGVHILNNYIHHIDGDGIDFGSCSFVSIKHNQIQYMGYPVYPRSGRAALSGIYNQPCSDVLIEENSISYVSDYLNPYGSRYVYRNNILGPSAPELIEHVDGVQPNGVTSRSLMEGNISRGNNSSDNHLFLNQLAGSTGWIIRYNSTFGSKGGFDWRNAGSHYFYNNTLYDTYTYYASGFQILLTSSINNLARNNIWYRAVSLSGNPYLIGAGSAVDKDYDLWFNSGDPHEDHSVNSDPQFVSASTGNFQLLATSPAIDQGGPLATTITAGNNSVVLQVTNAGPFQDGWAGVNRDWIAVGTSGNYSEIASINYSNNTITLRTPLTWSANAPVYLFKDSTGRQVLYGSAPDIGANEYGGGALVLPLTSPIPPTNPPNSPANPTTCTSFTYSVWGTCTAGTQTRTVLTSSPSGCTGGSPVTSQSCSATPPAPSVNASCSNIINQCSAGTFSDLPDTSINNIWSCLGSGLGNSVSCSLPKPTVPVDVPVPTTPSQPAPTLQPPAPVPQVVEKVIQTPIIPNPSSVASHVVSYVKSSLQSDIDKVVSKSPYRSITDIDVGTSTESQEMISDQTTSHSPFFVRVREILRYVYSRILNGVSRLFGYVGVSQTAAVYNVAQDSPELLTNGSMESTTAWTDSGGTTQGRSSEQAHGGTYSWKVSYPSCCGWAGVSNSLNIPNVSAGQIYRLSGWVYVTSGSVRIAIKDFSNHTLGSAGVTTLGSWQYAEAYATIPSGVTEITATALFDNSSGTFYMDDFSLKLATSGTDTGTGSGGTTPPPITVVNTPTPPAPDPTPVPDNSTTPTIIGDQIAAASCSRTDAQVAFDAAKTGDTVTIPAGTCTWTSVFNFNKAVTLKGAGIGQTTIINGVSHASDPNTGTHPQIMVMTSSSAGSTRLTDMTIDGGSGSSDSQNNGFMKIQGSSKNWRIDHVRFVITRTSALHVWAPGGVIDHNRFDLVGWYMAIYGFNGGGGNGDLAWAQPTNLGTDDALYIEDNTFYSTTPSLGLDGWAGQRVVVRYNNFNNSRVGNHGTESSQRQRGARSYEIYNNTFTLSNTSNYSDAIGVRSGVGVIFNNTVSGAFTMVGSMHNYRDPHPYSPWGQCDGTSPFDLNDTNDDGTTKVYDSGVSSLSASSVNQSITLTAQKAWTPGQWVGYTIWNTRTNIKSPISSNTATTIVGYTDNTNNGTPLSWSVNDPFKIVRASACLDQVGRGKGDLISGSSPTPQAWPHQELDPTYIWNNTLKGSVQSIGDTSVHIVENRDYYNNTCKPGYTPYTYPHPLTGLPAQSVPLNCSGGGQLTNYTPIVTPPITPPVIPPVTPPTPPVTPPVVPQPLVTPPVVPVIPTTPTQNPLQQHPTIPVITPPVSNVVSQVRSTVQNSINRVVSKSPYRSITDIDVGTSTEPQEVISDQTTSRSPFFVRVREILRYVYSRILNGVNKIFSKV